MHPKTHDLLRVLLGEEEEDVSGELAEQDSFHLIPQAALEKNCTTELVPT